MKLRRLVPGLVAAVLTVAACGGPETAGEDEVVGGLADALPGDVRTAVLPTGTLELTVGAPLSELSAADTRDAKARKAPNGSSFVPVHWDFDVSRAPLSGLLAADAQMVEVQLAVKDRMRSLPAPYSVEGKALAVNPATTFYVVVPGTPNAEDVDVSVTYDSKTQTLSGDGVVSGSGSGLADLVGSELDVVTCPETGWKSSDGVRVEVICDDLRVGVTPYWPGKGWAADGEAWRVVSVPRLGASRIERDGAVYSVDTVHGSAAGQDLLGTTYPDSVDGTVVFPDTDSVQLRLKVSGSLTRGPGPLAVDAQLSQNVRLP